METTNHCTRCRFATNDDDVMETHIMIHKARIIKFEPLKTHIAGALSQSRSQEDTANWEQALTLVQALIDPCPSCGLLDCQCEGTVAIMDSMNNQNGMTCA